VASLKSGGGAIPDDVPMLEQQEAVSDLQFNPFDGSEPPRSRCFSEAFSKTPLSLFFLRLQTP